MKSKETICPVCGKYYFEFPNDFNICPICDWENDGIQNSDENYWGGANSMSLNEARIVYSLLQKEETKAKVSAIIEMYYQKHRNINVEFAEIDHRTIDGERWRNAMAKAHDEFTVELNKLANSNYFIG